MVCCRRIFRRRSSQISYAVEEHDSRGTAGSHCRQRDSDRRYRQDGQYRHPAGLCDRLDCRDGFAPYEIPPSRGHSATPWVPLIPISGQSPYGYMMYKLGWANLGTTDHLAGDRAGGLLHLQPEAQPGATTGREANRNQRRRWLTRRVAQNIFRSAFRTNAEGIFVL